MSTHLSVIAYVSDKDETYKKHLKVLQACRGAEIECLPAETAEYFGYKYPENDIEFEKLEITLPMEKFSRDYKSGLRFYVNQIPEGTYKIEAFLSV